MHHKKKPASSKSFLLHVLVLVYTLSIYYVLSPLVASRLLLRRVMHLFFVKIVGVYKGNFPLLQGVLALKVICTCHRTEGDALAHGSIWFLYFEMHVRYI
jgi:hypothetical protein